MIVIGILSAILAFTVVTFGTSLLMEKAYAGRLRPYVTLFSAVAAGSIALWLLRGGAADAIGGLTSGFTVKNGAQIILCGVAAGLFISGV
jgi:hypothetical protein